jgi:D-glycero-alpha-D-manno-heptose-7-phosphate kinase
MGGGSDLESHFKHHGGSVVSFAINKYVFTSINSKFLDGIRFAYSETENVSNCLELKHNIAREALSILLPDSNLEIATIADVPAKGTGLASSSAFTASFVSALLRYKQISLAKHQLAELVCDIEINLVKSPIGKQDQYATVFGGINKIVFPKEGAIDVKKIDITFEARRKFEEHLLIVHTGIDRNTNDTIFEISKSNNKNELLSLMSEMCDETIKCLLSKNFVALGELINYSWELKKKLSPGVTNDKVDAAIAEGISLGAYGGKLLGAGSGGFILFICPPDKKELIVQNLALRPLICQIEFEGTKIVYES